MWVGMWVSIAAVVMIFFWLVGMRVRTAAVIGSVLA
jgi:hypothetical protein